MNKKELIKILANAQIEEAIQEAAFLIENICKLTTKDFLLNPDIEFSKKEEETLLNLTKMRIEEGLPVQYLVNTAYFMGDKFYVDENVLIPRPETEILVDEVIKICKNEFSEGTVKIIDIGTGSGCIACELAKIKGTEVWAVDICEKALNIAKKNAEALRANVIFKKSDLLADIQEKFHIIVSNPPYIPEDETLQKEVLKEPYKALFGGENGLDFYKRIISKAKENLFANSYLAFEIGIGQSTSLKRILENEGFEVIKIVKDFATLDRVVVAKNSIQHLKSES